MGSTDTGRPGREPGARSAAADESAARTDRETTYHPAIATPSARGIPAGKVLIVVLVATLVAGLLNSAWMVRTAEGMRPGLGRTIVAAVAYPVDAVASAVGLDRPRQQVDLLLGREPAASDEIEADSLAVAPTAAPAEGEGDGDAVAVAAPSPTPKPVHVAPVTVPRPTKADKLNVLVLGDSLSTYTGRRLQEIFATKGLTTSDVLWRDGTGLATPKFFNWPAWALREIDRVKPTAVVVILGGNDHQDMERKGTYFAAGTPEWQAEYQRRVAVVMAAFIAHGVDRVYWSGPPTARDASDNALYRQLNLAAAAAAKTVSGARFVDLAGPTSLNGEWLDVLAVGNEAFRARMGDNFHWSWKAARITSRLVADSMAKDYQSLG